LPTHLPSSTSSADHRHLHSFPTRRSSDLDKYLQTQASQDLKKRLAAVYVLTPDGTTIAGYYTLSAYSVRLDKIPEEIARKLTRIDRKSTRLNSSHVAISYAVFCLKKKKNN